MLIKRAMVVRGKDVAKALSILDEALSTARKNDDKNSIAVVIREKAVCHLEQQHFKQALSGFSEAIAFFRELGDLENQLHCHSEISDAYLKLGEYPSALEHILENLSLYTGMGDSNGIASCYQRIGSIYYYLSDFEKAIEYHKRSLKIFEGLKLKKDILHSFYLLGNDFLSAGDQDKSLYYLLRTQHGIEGSNDAELKTLTLGGLAGLYTLQGDYDKALQHFHEALLAAENAASPPIHIRLKKELGNLYMNLTQYDKALEVLENALEQSGALPPDKLTVNICQLLALTCEKMGDTEGALRHYKRFYELDKQVTSEEVNLKTKALHYKFDLEELRKQKEIAELSDKLKEQFLANVSHEIRTPMNGVLGMTHLLNKTQPTGEQQEYIEAIKDSANNLMVIINDILDFSKINAGKVEFASTEFSLRDLIKGVLQILRVKADEKKLQLSVTVDYKVKDALIGDPIRLNQVLMNLIGNAIKFTEKGKVHLDVRIVESAESNCRLSFKVIDTGIGIPEDRIHKVFDSFEQVSHNKRRNEGTGLGLTIVRQLVELQGGSISVMSRVGEGSTFDFDLPFAIAPKPEVQKTDRSDVPDTVWQLSAMRILIVEDNRINQLLVKNMLKQFGVERFETAENARQAIRLLEEQSFDLVLMDIMLPEMDGFEITRMIRTKLPQQRRKVPVIALTADASESLKVKGKDAGMDDFLVKPYTPEELLAKLQKFAVVHHPSTESALLESLAEKRKNALFQLEVLERFTGGDLELTIQLIEIFLRQMPEAIQRLEKNIPLKNWPEVHAAAHKIKSSVSVFEMKELRRLIVKIEEAARDLRKLDEIPSCFSAFKFNSIQAMGFLEQELQRLQQERVNDL